MRYELIRKEPEGTWSVWDGHQGAPAEFEGRPAEGLSLEEAQDIHALLESADMKRRLYRGHIA
ncbi:hypothetical protein EOA23_12100 [Mesorhizobium sp. M2A.F.Ca.ET.042.01.1.1]|uniref:hypothetical protein n=1 Tax=Mesorhizobium sp. M2A.F.Ca.ET.042.01.1.1 TaxID=2496745 RepID=UPI000FCA4E69|nr:hypothetical protein [Mesorhizobium sp. M2A.F.Ca.ET.042.01.1.1]RUX30372.1 hypothetical protein EOA23_12100 [Mesorhizobium sp. M2A.F.Ca.ET.042.01.1.1]